MPDHEAGGGFAVGAGDGDDSEVFGGVMVFDAGGDGAGVVIGKDGLVVEGEPFEGFFEELFHRNIIAYSWFLVVVMVVVVVVVVGCFCTNIVLQC